MPRIDPQQLLKCLSVLLSPKGGIKSKDEVQRLASLMTKFSKKLVSKCIYVSILKATETDLLIMFMSAGGWDLTFTWLSDGVVAKNWPLVTELVELLLICPVDIDRLKTNACPKLIKTLSKDATADENVRLLACKLVEQWLRVVRGDNDPPQQTATVAAPAAAVTATTSQADTDAQSAVQPSDSVSESSEGVLPVYKITIRDGKEVLAKISGARSSTEGAEEECSTPTSSDDVNQEEDEPADVDVNDDVDDDDDDDEIKPVKLKKRPQVNKATKQVKKPAKLTGAGKKERDSTDSASSISGKSKLKENAKAAKKEKVESPKVKPNLKSKSLSPKNMKEIVENDVGASKKSDESFSNLKNKAKLSLSLKNKKSNLSNKDKKDIKNEKGDLKEKNILDEDDSLTEKEKESLKKLIAPPISKLGKIPKKSSSSKEEKQSEEKNRTLKEENSDAKIDGKKSYDIKKPEVKRQEKNFSIGVDRKAADKGEKPKTVKTYNSKFRSTGLEEEVKPPPPRPVHKKPPPPLFPSGLGLSEKKLSKRMSPPPEPHVPEKKHKPESPQEDKKPPEKAGGIKLIPPKPKPMFLQESDVFMDAMLAANTMKEPRKRKRKPSVSRDGPSDPKKEDHKNNSPSNSPKSEDSPSSVKPTFKFYQDTLETSMEDEKADKADDENLEFGEPSDRNSDDLGDDQKSMSSTEDEKVTVRVAHNGPLKGVLVHLKTRRQKKTVTWKEDGLEHIKYFELDETERVNVTKNFSDMKLMEREHERENFQLVRKLAVDDVMEEKTRWRALIPIDIAAPVVAPGKNSQEKEIQYAREKTVPAAVYFNKRMIPDSAAEPDLEIHATTDPAIIPLDDITGSTDSINDFTTTPWPEPKGPAPPPVPPPAPPATQAPTAPFPPAPAPGPGPFQGPFPPMGPPGGPFMPPGPPLPNSDCWRTGDGKVVPMPGDPMMMGPPQPMMGPPGPMGPMGPPGPMMLPPGVTPEMGPFPMMGPNPGPMPDEMHFPGGFPQMPGPFPPGPPVGPPQGPPQGWQGGGWQGYDGDQQGPPPPPHHNHNQSRGGSGWRGHGGRNPDGSWGGGNSRMPICNNFLKKGFCRNSSCRFRHPRN